MTNDKKPTSKKKLTNRGINANSHELEFECLASQISDDPEPHSPKIISVRHVREELKNVIETMGPNTLTDTENDETITETSYIQIPDTESDRKIQMQSTDEDSQMTTYNVSELVEHPIIKDTSMQTSNREFLCPNAYNNHFPQHNYCSHQMLLNENYPNILQERLIKQSYNIKRESFLSNWFGLKNNKECSNCKQRELYKMNIGQDKDDQSPPRRFVFDLLDELPKAETKTIGTNTKANTFQIYKPDSNTKVPLNNTANINNRQMKETVTERVDIYYFDHGNPEYYRTTDSPPLIKTEYIAERTDHYTKKFWAEFFGTLNIGISFVISFFLQFLRFLLQALLRPLTIGVVQLVSDYLFKPCLAVTFNGFVQPPMIFLYNFTTSVRDVCAPVADSVGYFIREISIMLKSIRLVQIDSQKSCNTKVGNTGQNCGTE